MIAQLTKHQEITTGEAVVIQKHIHGNSSTHWHEFFEIEFIIDGKGEYIVDGTLYHIKPGMIFFMTPINFHEVKNIDAEIINIMFSENIASPDALYSISESGIEHGLELCKNDASFAESLLREIAVALKENELTYASSLLNTLLFKLGKTAAKNLSPAMSYVRTAMLYIRNNFRSHIRLDDVAKAVDLSPTYLSSIFPKEAKMGYKKYLNTLRFEYAKKLILYSDMNIAEICFESGFDDYANFLRGFKQRFSLSPALYRKANSEKI